MAVARSPPMLEESFGSDATVVPEPNRVDTSTLEEGRLPPTEKMEAPKTILGQFKAAMFNSWINVLLVFAPVGIATHYAGVDP